MAGAARRDEQRVFESRRNIDHKGAAEPCRHNARTVCDYGFAQRLLSRGHV